MLNHQFGTRLRELRKERGLLQRDVEEALSLRPGAGSQYERGLREPGFAILVAVAEYFDVSIDYLLGRPEAAKESPALAAGRRKVREIMRRRQLAGGHPAEVLEALLAVAREASPHHFAPARLARVLGVSEAALTGRRLEAGVLLTRLAAYLEVPLTRPSQ